MYEATYRTLQELIIKDYDALCKVLALNSSKARKTLLNEHSVNLCFEDLDCFQKVDLAQKVNFENEFNFDISKSFLAFDNSDDWVLSFENAEETEEKKEFIELVESWSLNIDLPYYIEEMYISDNFEERFEGKLYFFFAELIDDYNFSDTIRSNYFKKLLGKIVEVLDYYDNILLKSKKLPIHLFQSFNILKKEYQKGYRLIYTEFQTQIGSFYQFESKLIKQIKKNTVQEKNYFTTFENVIIDNRKAKDLRDYLVDKGLISNKTNFLTLKSAFSDGSPVKINWTGGKDKLGCFIKILKDERKIKGQAHSVAKNIFNIDNAELTKLRNPHAKDYKNYKDELKSIIDRSL